MESKIIVVDDEPAVLGFLKELLQMQSWQVEAYSNASEALCAFRESPQNYRLLITDQTMPNMLGTELIAHMQAIRPINAILCTGYSEVLDKASAMQHGASAFLSKPFDITLLLNTVKNFGALDG